MNAETTTVNLASLSDKELETLSAKIEKELEKRRESRKKEALDKMREIAEGVGMTPEELLGLSGGGSTSTWQRQACPRCVAASGRRDEGLPRRAEARVVEGVGGRGRGPVKVTEGK